MKDITITEAKRVLRDRLGHLCELIADDATRGVDSDKWTEVLLNEVALVVDCGLPAYLKYSQKLDAEAVLMAGADEAEDETPSEFVDRRYVDLLERTARIEGMMTALIARTGPPGEGQ